jgi:hypothetical protein
MTLFEGNFKVLAGVSVEALEDLGVHIGDAARRLEEPGPLRVLANCAEQFADQFLDPISIDHD